MNEKCFFGKYELLERLAVGGMGEIYLAKQGSKTGIVRHVIVKTLLPENRDSEKFVQQFLDEARIAATLNHPNVVGLIEVGEHEGTIFIAMEYIRGRNLAQISSLALETRLDISHVVWAKIVHGAACGLHHAHEIKSDDGLSLGLVHRDISPQNIMIRSDGVTKILDFGIALISDKTFKTSTGILKGKLSYISPEQIANQKASPLSDQFSLGVIFWELICEEPLRSPRTDTFTLLQEAVQRDVPSVLAAKPRADVDLARIVAKMTRRKAEERYGSCQELADDLQAFLQKNDYVSQVEISEALSSLMPGYIGEVVTSAKIRNEKSSPSGAHQSTTDYGPTPSAEHSQSRLLSQTRSTAERIQQVLAWFGAVFLLVSIALGIALFNRDTSWIISFLGSRDLITHQQTDSDPSMTMSDAGTRGKGILRVLSQPPGASVWIEGAIQGTTPFEKTFLSKGKTYRIELRHPGYESQEHEVLWKGASAVRLELQMVVQTAEPGRLTLNSVPAGAEVYLDKRLLGATPLKGLKLRPNRDFKLRLYHERHQGKTITLRLKSFEHRVLNVRLLPLANAGTGAATTSLPPAKKLEGQGFLTVDTQPWTKVTIRETGTSRVSPFAKIPLPTGTYHLDFENRIAKIQETRKVRILRGETKLIRLDFQKP
jgi:serine/threonine protein kinase